MLRASVGKRIKYYRSLRNMTQEELAEKIGVTKQHLGYIERGGSYPSLEFLEKAGQELDVEPFNFLLESCCSDEFVQANPQKSHADSLSSFGFWTIDLKTGNETWSSILCRILQCPKKTRPCLSAILRFVHPDDAEAVENIYLSAKQGITSRSVCCRITSGKTVNRLIHILPDMVKNKYGENEQAVIAIQDVTEWIYLKENLIQSREHLENEALKTTNSLSETMEKLKKELQRRKQAEKEALKKTKHIERLLSVTPAILYTYIPESGRIEWHSPHFKKITGFSIKEIKSDFSLWHNSIHPEDRPVVQRLKEKAAEGCSLNLEYRIKTGSGQWRWLRDKAVPTEDASGRTVLMGVAVDVTKRRQMEEELRKSEEKYRAVMQQSMDMIYLHDLDGRILNVNEAALYKTGYQKEKLESMTIFDLHSGDLEYSSTIQQWQSWESGESYTFITQHVCAGGSLLPVEINTGKACFGNEKYILAIVRDIAERKKHEKRAHFLEYHDELTRLPNRKNMIQGIDRELSRARRYNTVFSLLMLDIDDLNKINHSHGYAAGDQVLREFADLLQKNLRQVDTAGRFSSDEFLVLLPQTDEQGAILLAHRLKAFVKEAPVHLNNTAIPYSFSYGLYAFQSEISSVDEMLKMTSKSMETARRRD